MGKATERRIILMAYLSHHWLLAGGTVPLGGRLNSLPAEVRLQQPQHTVQRAPRRGLCWCHGLRSCWHHWMNRWSWLGKQGQAGQRMVLE